MASSVSPLTGRLTAETRITIYGFLFDCDHDGSCQYIKRATDDTGNISTDIFAVSKAVSREAMETFFNNRTVRIAPVDVQALNCTFSEFLRDIQVIDGIRTTPTKLQSFLEKSLALPRIREVSIASDCLRYGNMKIKPPGILQHANMADEEDEMEQGYAMSEAYDKAKVQADTGMKPFITVREFAGMMGLGHVTPTDIGRYKLDGKYVKVNLLNTKLLKMWPEVTAMPEDFTEGFNPWVVASALAKKWDLRGHHPANYMAIVAYTSLQLWTAMFETAAPFWPEDYIMLPYELYSMMTCFMASIKGLREMLAFAEKNSYDFKLHKLTPQSPAHILEYATEFLSLNVGRCAFAIENADEPSWESVGPYWCEIEGGEPLGAILHKKHVEEHERSMAQVEEFLAMLKR